MPTPSTTLITNMKTVVNTAPTAATEVLANAAAGPITDVNGLQQSVLLNLQEASSKLTSLISVTDASDPDLSLMQNVLASLS